MRTLGQERAKFALDRINGYNGGNKKELKNLAASAPAMILQNGLGHTLSFFYSKNKPQHQELLNVIFDWLHQRFTFFEDCDNEQHLIKKLNEIEQSKYLLAQQEVLKMLEWYKRYANSGFLIDNEGD